MKRILIWSGRVLLGLLVALLFAIGAFFLYWWNLNRTARQQLRPKETLTIDGYTFRDLNANGRLDTYEDARQPIDARVEDLLSQMTLEEKVGLMWHPPIGMGPQGEVLNYPSPSNFFFNSTLNLLVHKKLRFFNLFRVAPAADQARWHNELQRLAEQDRLGIPVTISSDPRHGVFNFIGNDMLNSDFSKWPEPIGLAAAGDSLLTLRFGRIAAAEYRAVGIHTALHPMADLATEPRWARINGTFGADAALAARMTEAYVRGFQGDTLGPHSVACMTKHWPGGGPQDDGWDAHFRYGKDQVYPGNNFDYHLIPFEAAFRAGTAMIMPYYGVPKGQTPEDVGMNFNRYIIDELLRKRYGFDGIVCTDWGVIEGFDLFGMPIVEAKDYGVEQFSPKERIRKAIEAGVDQFGGNDLTDELIALVREGAIPEARIDESVRRLLRIKFQLGQFDDPWVDESRVREIVARPEFVAAGRQAQQRALVLIKNDTLSGKAVLPLRPNLKLWVQGFEPAAFARWATVVSNIEEADLAVLHLQTPWEPRNGDMIEQFFHQGRLDYPPQTRDSLLAILRKRPAVVCMYMDRPPVIPEIAREAAALVADFGISDEAFAEWLFGQAGPPTGHLPFELPASMASVEQQLEDVPCDTPEPLYPCGWGLSW